MSIRVTEHSKFYTMSYATFRRIVRGQDDGAAYGIGEDCTFYLHGLRDDYELGEGEGQSLLLDIAATLQNFAHVGEDVPVAYRSADTLAWNFVVIEHLPLEVFCDLETLELRGGFSSEA